MLIEFPVACIFLIKKYNCCLNCPIFTAWDLWLRIFLASFWLNSNWPKNPWRKRVVHGTMSFYLLTRSIHNIQNEWPCSLINYFSHSAHQFDNFFLVCCINALSLWPAWSPRLWQTFKLCQQSHWSRWVSGQWRLMALTAYSRSSTGRRPAQPEEKKRARYLALALWIFYLYFSLVFYSTPTDLEAIMQQVSPLSFTLWVSAWVQKGQGSGSLPEWLPLPQCLWKNATSYKPEQQRNEA